MDVESDTTCQEKSLLSKPLATEGNQYLKDADIVPLTNRCDVFERS